MILCRDHGVVADGHILVMRLSAMGDVAMTVHAVKALRASYPSLRITVLTRPFFKPFFRDVAGVEFYDPDLKGRHKGPAGLLRLFRELEALDFDYVADLHDVVRTQVVRTLFRLGTKARVAVVDKGRAEKRAMTRKFRKILEPVEPMVVRYADVFARLGFRDVVPVPRRRKPRALFFETVQLTGLKEDKTWIGVAPFAQHKGKIYPTRLADEFIGMLPERFDRVFVFGGGPYEAEFAQYVEDKYPRVVSVIGKLELSVELDLISNLDCMVTMDSASMHMASLVGTPVVSVWGATHPCAGFYGFGQSPDNAVQLAMPCRPCSVYGNKRCMYGDYRCLGNIDPGTIFARVIEAARER